MRFYISTFLWSVWYFKLIYFSWLVAIFKQVASTLAFPDFPDQTQHLMQQSLSGPLLISCKHSWRMRRKFLSQWYYIQLPCDNFICLISFHTCYCFVLKGTVHKQAHSCYLHFLNSPNENKLTSQMQFCIVDQLVSVLIWVFNNHLDSG